MTDGVDEPRVEAEGELALARMALDSGEVPHAANHVANALAHDPTLPEAHEVLHRVASRWSGDLAELYPLDDAAGGGPSVGTVVAHAHLVARTAPADALMLLVAASKYDPGRPWDAGWLQQDDLAARIGADGVGRACLSLGSALPDPVPAGDQASLAPYADLARAGVAAFGDHQLMLLGASALLRRLGAAAEAVACAGHAEKLAPTYLSSVFLGYAHRAAGDVGEAVAAWQRALRHQPDDVAVRTDIAELLDKDGRLDEALTWIERAVAIAPDDPSAFPTACVLRYRADGDVAHLVALADYLPRQPDNGHAHRQLTQACRQPWLGWVPQPTDAVVNMLRQVLADDSTRADSPRDDGGESLVVTVSAPEAPSALRTFQRVLPRAEITVSQVLTPESVEPRRPVRYGIWRYHGSAADATVTPAQPAAADVVTRLAEPNWWHPVAAYDAAVALSGQRVADLLGLMAHPPGPPDTELGQALARYEPALWVRGVQVFACLGLLHHRVDEPWPTSTRRAVLVDLAFGVEDWVTEAAVYALVVAAWVDPAVRPDVVDLVAARLVDAADAAQHRPMLLAGSLATLAKVTPGMPAEFTRLADTVIAWTTDDES